MDRAPFANIPQQRPSRAARAGAAALYVALGATALAALAFFESDAVRAEPRSEGTGATPAAAQSGAPATARAPLPFPRKAADTGATDEAPGKAAQLTSTSTGAAAADAAALGDTKAAPAPLTVPSFRGTRLSWARREAEKMGLVVRARDDEGQRVPSDRARYYRVRRQLTKAGTPVEAGTAIDLRVEEDEAVEGY
jgi:hypothetical protein